MKTLSKIFGLIAVLLITAVISPAVAAFATPEAATAVGGGVLAVVFFASIGAAPSGLAFSVPAGTFDCAQLTVVMGKMEELWADAQVQSEYIPNAQVLQAIIENQTAKIDPLVGLQGKDNTMKITWISDCPSDPDDCGTDCMPEGDELGVDCKEYVPTICKEIAFKINETDLRSTTYTKDELLARALLKRVKLLDEKLSASAVSFLEDSEGKSDYVGSIGTQVGTAVGNSYIKIAPANWTADLLGYFKLSATKNKFTMPFMITGENLYQAYWNAQMNAANADGKGNLNKFQQLPFYTDLFNIDTAFSNPTSFLLNKGAVAFGCKWEYPEQPTDLGGNIGKRWSIASRTLPNVRYDVHYNAYCETGKKIVHKFNVIARGGLYLNPVGCAGTNTGVLRFEKAS